MVNSEQIAYSIYNEIRTLYTSGRFSEVIDYWAKNRKHYPLSKNYSVNESLLVAIGDSYFELGLLKKSLHFRRIQLKAIRKAKLSIEEKKESYRYCFYAILEIHCIQNSLISQYRTRIRSYQVNSYEEEYLKQTRTLEKLLYKKYQVFLKQLVYVLIPMVIIMYLLQKAAVIIPEIIYKPYGILSVAGLLMALLDRYAPKTSKKIFLSFLRIGIW